jgi:hypothetical protein
VKKFKNKKGQDYALLNPSEKGGKYAHEMKTGIAQTNLGEVKLNKKGQPKKLSLKQKAFRAGYLSAQKDSANAYKAKNAKK